MTGTASLLMANTEGGGDGITENVVLEAIGRSLKVINSGLGYGDGPSMPAHRVEEYFYPDRRNVIFSDTADKVIKGSAGFLHAINITRSDMTGTGMLFTIYDNSAGSGTVIAVLDPTSKGSFIFDCECTFGITGKLSGTGAAGSMDITFSSR